MTRSCDRHATRAILRGERGGAVVIRRCSALLLAALLVGVAPAAAQDLAALDALSDRSAEETGGLALAREQAARGELLEALATLERVLALFPKSPAARLDHAVLLCRVGDPQGAEAEFARLDAEDYPSGALAQARAACRPAAAQEG